jgi:hypothetical protein
VEELIIRKSPILSRINAVPSATISTSRKTFPSGEVVENPPINVRLEFHIEFSDAIEGRLDPLIVSIDEAAETKLRVVTTSLFEFSGRLSEAAGTAIGQ